jgi:CubicO group peptidase (beta-lactamase class C family)
VRDDDVLYCDAFGYADIESQRPMRPDVTQRIASITKTMVGLCVMALVDEGKVRLDDRLVALVPDVAFHGPADGITLRHLLTHTSGIGEAPSLDRLREFVDPNYTAAPGAFSELYPDGVVVECEPGTKHAYCNNGYALLGRIIERTEEATLQDVMRRRIWGPLGMAATNIRDENDASISTCYHRAPSEDRRFQFERAGIEVKDEDAVDGLNIRGTFRKEFNVGMLGAGGVQSTLPDMARYASALLRKADGIVRPETFDAMIAPQHVTDPRMVSWGLSFARAPLSSAAPPGEWPALIGHGGAYFGGWNSHIDVLPQDNIGIVQHMNVMLDDPQAVFRSVIRAVLDVPRPAFDPRPAERDVLASAPGLYELPVPGTLTNFRPQTRIGRVTIESDGDELVLRSRWGTWKEGVRITPCDADDASFFAIQHGDAEPAFVAFTRDTGGRVDGLHLDDLHWMRRRP